MADPQQPLGETRQFLSFSVGKEEYAVDIMTIREIRGWTETTRLPGSPPYMRGVMNLRGLIIPIFDLRTRLQQGTTEVTPRHVVVILAVAARTVGLLVDAVSDILDISDEQIRPAPAEPREPGDSLGSSTDAAFIDGLLSLQGRMVVLLNVERLFDVRQIDKAVSQAA